MVPAASTRAWCSGPVTGCGSSGSTPDDYNRIHANAYYALGCNSPIGPCGSEAGGAHGGTFKPSLSVCHDNGDFSIVNDGGTAYVACTMVNQTFNIEQLDQWWVNGTGAGAVNVIGRSDVESPAVSSSGSTSGTPSGAHNQANASIRLEPPHVDSRFQVRAMTC
jgi:hypothetical protein